MRLGFDLVVWLPLAVSLLCHTVAVICGDPPKILGDKVITYKAKVGETVKLKCRATGAVQGLNTRTLFFWQKTKGGLIRSAPEMPRFTIKHNKHLKIRNVQPQDAGEYKCTATNEFGFDVVKRLLVVTNPEKVPSVTELDKVTKPKRPKIPGSPIPPNFIQDEKPPTILKRSDSSNYKEYATGSSAKLKCVVTGVPRPAVTWKKNGQPLQQTGQIRVGSGNTVLVFKILTQKDTGNYTCIAVNKLGQANKTYIVNVTKHMKFRDPESKRTENVTAVYRGNVTLFCETDLKSKRGGLPRIDWYRWMPPLSLKLLNAPEKGGTDTKGKNYRYRKSYSNKNGTISVGLTMLNVTWQDRAEYVCLVGSGKSRVTAKVVRLVVTRKETNQIENMPATSSKISSKIQIPLFIVITVPVVAGMICITVVLACWRVHRKKVQETKRRSIESVQEAKENEPLQNEHIKSLEKGLNHVPNGHANNGRTPNSTAINHVSNGKVPNGIKLTIVHHNSSNGVTTKCINGNGILPLCHDSETENETET